MEGRNRGRVERGINRRTRRRKIIKDETNTKNNTPKKPTTQIKPKIVSPKK